jgi:formate dehydrogenase iron-sulfur subunit
VCATKALVAGDSAEVRAIMQKRVDSRGTGESPWGWSTAYPGA